MAGWIPRLLGLSVGLPGEVLLQRHHLPPAPLRRPPLPSLHAQMFFHLQLQIIALLDLFLVGVAAGKRENNFTVNPARCNPSEGARRRKTSVQSFSLLGEDHTQASGLSSTLDGPGVEVRTFNPAGCPRVNSLSGVLDPPGHQMCDSWSVKHVSGERGQG